MFCVNIYIHLYHIYKQYIKIYIYIVCIYRFIYEWRDTFNQHVWQKLEGNGTGVGTVCLQYVYKAFFMDRKHENTHDSSEIWVII